MLFLQLDKSLLANLTQLTLDIGLSDSNFTCLQRIAENCHRLVKLNISLWSIPLATADNTEHIVDIFAGNPTLTHVDVSWFTVTDKCIDAMALYLPNLEWFCMKNKCILNVKAESIANLLCSCPKLITLHLRDTRNTYMEFDYARKEQSCRFVTWWCCEDIKAFFEKLELVKSLGMETNCNHRNIVSFRKIAINNMTAIASSKLIELISRNSPGLESLELFGSELNVAEIMVGLPSVRTLQIDMNTETDETEPVDAGDLIAVCQTHPSLTALDLNEHPRITTEQIVTIIETAKNMKALYIDWCDRVNLKTVRNYLTEKGSSLVIEH